MYGITSTTESLSHSANERVVGRCAPHLGHHGELRGKPKVSTDLCRRKTRGPAVQISGVGAGRIWVCVRQSMSHCLEPGLAEDIITECTFRGESFSVWGQDVEGVGVLGCEK